MIPLKAGVVGAVESTFVTVTESVLAFPALSVALAFTVWLTALSPSVVEPEQVATPETLSEQVNVTVGFVLYQPFVPSGAAGETACVMAGPVESTR